MFALWVWFAIVVGVLACCDFGLLTIDFMCCGWFVFGLFLVVVLEIGVWVGGLILI